MPKALTPPRVKVPRLDASFLSDPLFKWQRVNEGTRSWSWAMGLDPNSDPELFVLRAIRGVAQQFNFWQDRREESKDFNADTVWRWVRDEASFSEMTLNLKEVRQRIHLKVEEYISEWYRFAGSMVGALQCSYFWAGLNRVWNSPGMEDPVFKKVVLLKMILEDSGFSVFEGERWGHACVDYNVLVVLNHFNILRVPGGLWGKAELDKVRLVAYWVCYELLVQWGTTPSKLDGVLFFAGRELRKEYGESVVPKVLNETNY